MTTAESEKCGITSLFVMSCKGRAEAFARRLQSRLTCLNKEQEKQEQQQKQEPNETTRLVSSDQIAIVQPTRHSLKLSDSSSSCSDEVTEESMDDNIKDVSLSSAEYCSCLDDFSRTLTEDSFTSLESEGNEDQNGDDTKSEDDKNNSSEEDQENTINADDIILLSNVTVMEENKKNEEKNFSNGEEVKCGEIIENFCDILNVDDGRKDCLFPPEEITSKTDILNLLNTETNSENDQEEEITPLRRCSSLKTGKTPPGTPGRKKIVRFADVLGLDLADVRTFLDEIPKIPNSAYIDLQDANLTSSVYRGSPEKILIPLFTQPGGLSDFLQRVHDNKVCLENALVDDLALMSVKGTVRVLNLDFHKNVHIRYSLDGWRSFSDLQCSYVLNSCDGFSDKFTFLVYANTLRVGERLEFAIKFQCRNFCYWDNNNRCNYSFQCLPTTNSMPCTPITTEEPWGTAFY